jgi:LacI family transcriptional regulator
MRITSRVGLPALGDGVVPAPPSEITLIRPALARRPTQADVARAAGVSQAAVSYVLNGRAEAVSEETYRRVLEAIADLGYVPNTPARNLRTRRTMTVAGVIPDITNPFYPAFERGIQEVADRHGYDLVTYNTDGLRERELKCLDSARRGRLDGVIGVLFHVSPEELLAVHDLGVAVVALSRAADVDLELPYDRLFIDNAAAAKLAVDYLIERGHSRIGMVSGETGTPPREGRVAGYRQALREHSIPLDEVLIRAGNFTEEGGYQGMRELLKVEPRPTAVFAANDLMAMGALIALREAGRRVPEEMALVGFDDIPAARMVQPPLTTIAQYPERLGKRAAEMLFERLAGTAPELGRRETMPVALIVRESA